MTAVRYALDSNVARQVKLWRDIATAIDRLRQTDPTLPLLAIPPPVHAEMTFYLRRTRGVNFSTEAIDALLDGVAEIVALDRDASEAVADRLAAWHPTQEHWDAAKRRACADCVGAPRDPQPAKPKRCPATIDWYIAGHAAAHGWTVVTEDGGPEWQNVPTIRGAALLAQRCWRSCTSSSPRCEPSARGASATHHLHVAEAPRGSATRRDGTARAALLATGD